MFPSTAVSNVGMAAILPQQNSGIVFRKENDKCFLQLQKASKAVDPLADYAGIIQACGSPQSEGLNHYYRICRVWFFSNTCFTLVLLCNISVIETQGSRQLRCLLGICMPSPLILGRHVDSIVITLEQVFLVVRKKQHAFISPRKMYPCTKVCMNKSKEVSD